MKKEISQKSVSLIISTRHNNGNDDDQDDYDDASDHCNQLDASLPRVHLEFVRFGAHFESTLLYIFRLLLHLVHFLLVVDYLFQILLHLALCLIYFGESRMQLVISGFCPLLHRLQTDSVQMLE